MAVTFAGVNRVRERDYDTESIGASQGIDKRLYLKWLGLTARVAQRDMVVSEACKDLTERLEMDGFLSCVLKGQSNLVNYNKELNTCRTPGDIDVWMMPMECVLGNVVTSLGVRRKRIVEYVKQMAGNQHVLYHHVECPLGLDVEAHFTPSWMKNLVYNARVQRFFDAKKRKM